VILADTSAWIELLRATGSAVHQHMSGALRDETLALASTDPVVMEVLGGARDQGDWDFLRRLLFSLQFLPVEGPSDYEVAAELYRRCRGSGETPRGFSDCLIAAVAIRNDVEVLSSDTDFAVIARHSTLRLAAT
jgi:predicted nucleic acid-binding protein